MTYSQCNQPISFSHLPIRMTVASSSGSHTSSTDKYCESSSHSNKRANTDYPLNSTNAKKMKLSSEYSSVRVPPVVACKRRKSQRSTAGHRSRARGNPGIAAENAFLLTSLQKILQSVADISDPVLREKVMGNPEFVRIKIELAKQRLLPTIEEEDAFDDDEYSQLNCSSATSHCSEGSVTTSFHHSSSRAWNSPLRGEVYSPSPSSAAASDCYHRSSMSCYSSMDEEMLRWDSPSEGEGFLLSPAPSALSEVACCYLDIDNNDHLDLQLDDDCSQASSTSSASLHPQNWLPQLNHHAIW